MSFPITRMRRLRRTESLRALVRETQLSPENFILPLFVCPGEGVRREVSSMPGVFNTSVDEAVNDAREAHSLGIGGVILFGLPSAKDERGTEACAENGIVQQGLRAIKSEVPKLLLLADVCLCEYTSHGHCGVVQKNGDEFRIDNDATL
ncbi:MAG TPA: porphobilinogen synthase, partial [Terriglobales bacterium]